MLLLEVDPVVVGTSQKHTPKCVELSSFCCLSDVNSNRKFNYIIKFATFGNKNNIGFPEP